MKSWTDQKTPLMKNQVSEMSPKYEELKTTLELDDDARLRRVLQEWDLSLVWRPQNVPSKGSMLHQAVKLGATRCLGVLLGMTTSSLLLDSPDGDGRTAVHIAAKSGNPNALKELADAGCHINARDARGQSPLHYLAYATAECNIGNESFLQCLDGLLERQDVDLEAHTRTGYTPLMIAAHEILHNDKSSNFKNLVKFCRKLVSFGASLEEVDEEGESVRGTLEKHRCLTQVLMCEIKPSPERPLRSKVLDALVLGISNMYLKPMLSRRPSEEVTKISNDYLGMYTLLFTSVDQEDEDSTECLLDQGADPWAVQLSGELPLHRAFSRGSIKIVNSLLEKMKEKRNINVLDLQEHTFTLISNLLQGIKQRRSETNTKHSSCLERLFKPDIKLDLSSEDSTGRYNALHLAAVFNNQEAISRMLKAGSFIGARMKTLDEALVPIYNVIRLQTLEDAMDNSISKSSKDNDQSLVETDDLLHPNYTLDLDYTFLVPLSQESEKKGEKYHINEVETLMEIGRVKSLLPAIKHPLIRTLLYVKWMKALPIYLFNLAIYLTFVMCLIFYLYSLVGAIAQSSNPSLNQTVQNEVVGDNQPSMTELMFLKAVLLLMSVYMGSREVVQGLMSPWSYSTNFENWIQCFLVIIVLILCLVPMDLEAVKHMSAWAMIAAWYEFVLILGRIPALAIYVTMLRHVSWNFLKLIFLYGALIVAFTISFNIIFNPWDQKGEGGDFSSFWNSLPKAIVMATGEFEYSDLSSEISRRVIYAASAVALFLVFLFLIFLVLMNVMNGMAVTDTQNVLEEATVYSLMSRLELVYLAEEILLRLPFLRRFLPWMQLLSGSNVPRMSVSINNPRKGERIRYGDLMQKRSRLSDAICAILREHRMRQLEEEESTKQGDTLMKCFNLLQEMKRNAKSSPHSLPKDATIVGSDLK